jgi:hypothetical protein
MADNLEILNTAVSLLVRAALLAACFSGRLRKRSLKRLAARDTDAQAKEILFLKDRVYQLEMQVSILQKHLHNKDKKPRYEVRERLLILWHVEAFQIPRRKVSRYFGIARSTLYRWLHKVDDQKPSATPANKTPAEIAALVWEMTKANLSWGRIRIANQLKLLGIFLSGACGPMTSTTTVSLRCPNETRRPCPGISNATSSSKRGSRPTVSRPPRSSCSIALALSPCPESAHAANIER